MLSPTSQLRQRFRVTRATRVVSGIFIKASRYNASAGSLTFVLESGPASDTAGNGSIIQQVSIPASVVYDVGSGEVINAEAGPTVALDFVHWIWVPFTANRTLTLGQLYNARLYAPSGSFRMWCSARADTSAAPPAGTGLTWDQWEAQRQIEWTAWDDSRGMQISGNSGSTWAFATARLPMMLFKCV